MFVLLTIFFVGLIISIAFILMAVTLERLATYPSFYYLVFKIKLSALRSRARFTLLKNKFSYFHNLKRGAVLTERGQIPLMAFGIIEGKADVFYLDKKITELGPMSIVGFNEIIHDIPCDFTIKIHDGSLLGAIGKSELLSA